MDVADRNNSVQRQDARPASNHRHHHHPPSQQHLLVNNESLRRIVGGGGERVDDGKNGNGNNADDDDDDDDINSRGSMEEETHSLEDSTLGWRETRQVQRFRYAILLFLVTSCILVSYGIFRILRQNEWDTMETQFKDEANKVLDSFQAMVERKLGTLDALSIAMTSHGLHASANAETAAAAANWPNVTMESYGILAGDVQSMLDAVAVLYTPVVEEQPGDLETTASRAQWQQYSLEHQDDWIPLSLSHEQAPVQPARDIHSSISVFDKDTGSVVPLPHASAFRRTKTTSLGEQQEVVTYSPTWHTSPVIHDLINVDLLAQGDFTTELERVLDSKEALVGDVTVASDDDYVLQALIDSAQTTNTQKNSPLSLWFFPVFDSLGPSQDVVGIITVGIYWESYFANILPPDTPAMDVVLANSCDPDAYHTFQITPGQTVDYVGPRDLHENNDFHVESSNIFDFPELQSSVHRYKGKSLGQMCESYTLHLYPTDETRDEYLSDRPVYFLVLVICIFLATILIMLCYDRNVEARQRIVLSKAEQANAIVKSMFPAAVRKRLYDEQMSQGQGGDIEASDSQGARERPASPRGFLSFGSKHTSRIRRDTTDNTLKSMHRMEPEKMKIKSFLQHNPAAKEFAKLKAKTFDVDGLTGGGPLADTFPETTILFADIVGFTAWSSEREPQQVFTLLQTLYHNFDGLAKRYLVFKVETIGDCYVAATGLPDSGSIVDLDNYRPTEHDLGVPSQPKTK